MEKIEFLISTLGTLSRESNLGQVSFRHVGRKGNGVAHRLAQYALIEPNSYWIEDIPPCIVSDVLQDKFSH